MSGGDCVVQAFPRRMKRSSRQYFDRVSSIARRPIDDEGREEITVQFEAGGRLHIITDRALLWVDPEVH